MAREAVTEEVTEWRGTKDRWIGEEWKENGEVIARQEKEAAEGNGGKGARGESAAAVAARELRLEETVAATLWRGEKNIVTVRETSIEESEGSIAISAGSERTA